jgi:hypothetical protein
MSYIYIYICTHGEGKGVYRVLVGRPEGKRLLGRYRRRWDDNIKLDLREIGIDGANWIAGTLEGPVAGFCEHGNEPLGSMRKAGYVLIS